MARTKALSVLTNAQVYTLRRLASGRSYMCQGNGKRAFERRKEYRVGFDDVNAPSIPPLIRKGLARIDPRYTNPNPTSYYPVVLTVEGVKAAKEAVIND
ncbi:hypothetical protein [Escherichia phage KW1E_UTAR]|nr:hypothetical protein [Escherichia phage KW1E_UTAR]